MWRGKKSRCIESLWYIHGYGVHSREKPERCITYLRVCPLYDNYTIKLQSKWLVKPQHPITYQVTNILTYLTVVLVDFTHISPDPPWSTADTWAICFGPGVSGWPGVQSTSVRTKPIDLLQWRLNEHDGASNRHLDCLLNCLLRRRSERKYQSFMPLASVRGVHRWPVDSPPKGPATRKMFPFGDVVVHLMSPNSIRTIYRCTTTILVTYYLDPSSHRKSISVEISFHCHFIPGLDIFAYGTEAVVSYSISYSGWLIKPLHAKFSLET